MAHLLFASLSSSEKDDVVSIQVEATHSPTHSLTYSLTHLLTHSPTHSLIVSIQVETLLSMGVDEDFRFTLPSTKRSQGLPNDLAKFMSALQGGRTSGWERAAQQLEALMGGQTSEIAQQLGALISESNEEEDESSCGPTALYLAAKLGRYDSVRHLLDAGADFGIRYLDMNDQGTHCHSPTHSLTHSLT